MLKKELTFVLNYALKKGFQIHPDAFEFLENVDIKKLEKIIKEIVREKTKQKLFRNKRRQESQKRLQGAF